MHPKGPLCSRDTCETTDAHRRRGDTYGGCQIEDRSPSDSCACSFWIAVTGLCPNVKGRGVPPSWEQCPDLVGTLCPG
jgi:hypothetical protein